MVLLPCYNMHEISWPRNWYATRTCPYNCITTIKEENCCGQVGAYIALQTLQYNKTTHAWWDSTICHTLEESVVTPISLKRLLLLRPLWSCLRNIRCCFHSLRYQTKVLCVRFVGGIAHYNVHIAEQSQSKAVESDIGCFGGWNRDARNS